MPTLPATTDPKRILVIGVDPAEATHRLRIAILPGLLEPLGYQFNIIERPATFLARRRLIATANRYHAVIIQRKLLDPSHARLLRKLSPRIFYDIDDAVMVQRRQIGKVSAWLKNRRYLATAAVADHVVAGNQYLADQFRRLGRPATVLPTVVNPADYAIKTHQPTNTPALVWIGSHSTLPYLRQWMPQLEQAAKLVPNLRLITIANATVTSEKIRVEHIPWSQQSESTALLQGDIGIAPTPLDQWTIGKSGFKIIQYMAAGLPTITSPVGANADILQPNQTGLLPPTPNDWPQAIAQLATNPQRRTQMGAAARQAVEEHYSLQRARDVWAKLLATPPGAGG